MKKNTKTRIWKEALHLFSIRGYDGVSVKDIAHAVGIKDASLYNHYQSKQEIFDTILQEVTVYLQESQSKRSTMQQPSQTRNICLRELIERCDQILYFYLEDELISEFRKLLIVEQFSKHMAATLFKEMFIETVLKEEEAYFTSLIKEGSLIEADAYLMALQFYSPLFLLMFRYEREDLQQAEIKALLDKHVISFAQTYIKLP